MNPSNVTKNVLSFAITHLPLQDAKSILEYNFKKSRKMNNKNDISTILTCSNFIINEQSLNRKRSKSFSARINPKSCKRLQK